MKKLFVSICACLMVLSAANVLAAEPRLVIIDETTTTVNIQSATILKAVYTHYSNYGASSGMSGYGIIENSASQKNVYYGGSIDLDCWVSSDRQNAYATGTYQGLSKTDVHHY